MTTRRLAHRALAFLAALWLSGSVGASPITVVVQTQDLAQTQAGTPVQLLFELTASTGNSVSVTDFASDGTLDASSIVTIGDVTGTLATLPVVLTGPGFQIDYQEDILLKDEAGSSVAFTFDTTAPFPVDLQNFGPDTFSLFIIANGAPVDTGGPGGALLTYEFGIENPVLTFFSSATLPVGEGTIPSVAEPSAFALVIAALTALAMLLPVAQIRSRK